VTLTQNDIGALAYLGRRIREETIGASKWDEPGIAAGVRRMIDRGFGFDEILDQVVNHARDKAAKNPGVLGHPVSTPPPEIRVRRGVTRDQQCERCGLRKLQCVCGPMAKQKPGVASTDERVRPELDRAREAIAQARQHLPEGEPA
jgi:hypothetical protein